MEIFSHIISNPLYSLIFGSGGVAFILKLIGKLMRCMHLQNLEVKL